MKMKNFKKPEAEERLAAAGRVPRGRQPGYGGNEAGRLLPPGTVFSKIHSCHRAARNAL